MPDSIFWSSDHEHYDGTEIAVERIRDAVDGEPVGDEAYVAIVDHVEGKKFGQYGPKVNVN